MQSSMFGLLPATGSTRDLHQVSDNKNEPFSKTHVTLINLRCNACGWPLCSQFCHGVGEEYGHSNTECAVLKETKSENGLDYADFSKLRESYNAVVPLRCLLKKETNPKCFETIIDMESHNNIRRNIPDLWNLNQTMVVDRIRRDWGLTEFSEEEIHSICGILEVVLTMEMFLFCINVNF